MPTWRPLPAACLGAAAVLVSTPALADEGGEMQALFLAEAAKYQVLPLDNSTRPRLITPRPSATAGRTVFTYTGSF